MPRPKFPLIDPQIREQPGSFFQPKHLKSKASPAPGRARSSWACRSAPSAAGSGFPGQSTFALHRAETSRAVRRPEELSFNAPEHKTTGSTAERKQGCVGDRQLLKQIKIPIFAPKHGLPQILREWPWEIQQGDNTKPHRVTWTGSLLLTVSDPNTKQWILNPSLRIRPQESLLAMSLFYF